MLLLVLLTTPTWTPQDEADSWILDPHWQWRQLSASFEATGVGEAVRATVVVPAPQSDCRQYVAPAEVSPGGWSAIEADALGVNRLGKVELRLRRGRMVVVHFHYRVATRGRRLDLTRTPRTTISRDPAYVQFLRPGPSTGLDDEALQDAAKGLFVVGDAIQSARRAYEATMDRLTYDDAAEFRGAARAWSVGAGHCADYAAVFVALCRCAGLPARAVAGYRFQGEEVQPHVWAEFHVSEAGWVPCDPATGDGDDDARERWFARIPAGYIAMSRDMDLDLQMEGLRRVPGLQEYAISFEGAQAPEVRWQVRGRILPNEPAPAAAGEGGSTDNCGIGAAGAPPAGTGVERDGTDAS
jgi:hypothetical protein